MERVTDKKALFVFLTILAVTLTAITIFACVSRSFSFALAQNLDNDDVVEIEYVSGNYYQFGNIVAISADDNSNFYTIEIIDNQAYLRIIESNRLVALNNTSVDNYQNIELVAFNDKLFIKQDDGIYYYSLINRNEPVKVAETTYDYTSDDKPVQGVFKSYAGAIKDGVLVIDYTSIILFIDVNDEQTITLDKFRQDKTKGGAKITSYQLGSAKGFDKMLIENSENGSFTLHLYNTQNGERFTRLCIRSDESGYVLGTETSQNALTSYTSKDLYSYFNGGLVLRDDGLYAETENGLVKTIKINTPTDTGVSDEYIKEFSKMTVGGDYLYVVDNGQNAVKVFDKQYKLYALYGSYGIGVGSNAQGLTRLRSPKFLCYDDNYLALFDDGNSRIVLFDYSGNVVNTRFISDVSGLVLADNGIWVTVDKTLVKYDYDFNELFSVTGQSDLYSLTTDGKHVFVVDERQVFVASDKKLQEYREDFTVEDKLIGGKHEGVFYTDGQDKLVMFKDAKTIVTKTTAEHDYTAIDCRGNVLCGKGYTVNVYFRQLNGFVDKTYTVDIPLNEVVITSKNAIFGISGHGLVKLTYDKIVFNDSDFVNPDITYPVKAIKVTEKCLGYVRPDNYESVIEASAKSYVLFAKTSFEGNEYYFTETLMNGRYVDLYIPADNAVVLDDGHVDNPFIKYGGADDEPKAYQYPSLTASPVCNIVVGQSYKVVRVVADDWRWYEIEIDGTTHYVNASNYISAEPLYKTVERYYLRAKSDVLGEQVTLYSLPDENSDIIAYVGEGTVLELTEPYDENSEFLQIRYNKGIAYVKTKNIQKNGLTESQKFALCFAGTVVGLTAIFGVLSLTVRRRKVKNE